MKIISAKKEGERLYLVKYKTGFRNRKTVSRYAYKNKEALYYHWRDTNGICHECHEILEWMDETKTEEFKNL